MFKKLPKNGPCCPIYRHTPKPSIKQALDIRGNLYFVQGCLSFFQFVLELLKTGKLHKNCFIVSISLAHAMSLRFSFMCKVECSTRRFISALKSSFFFLMVFSFLPKNVHFISKYAVLCLFLKNVSPSKTVVCFILNNLHFPMVEGIAFYALYKSRVLMISCKADDFCLFIGLPDEI